MDVTDAALSMAASAAGGCAVTLVAFYKFFVPRDRCEQKHKQVHDLSNREAARARDHETERKEFLELRRDVRWQGSIMRAVAQHLGIVVPEEPESE